MRYSIFLTAIILTFCSCNNARFLYSSIHFDWTKKYPVSGTNADYKKQMTPFKTLRVNGNFDIDVKIEKEYSIMLTGDKGLFKYFRTYYKGAELNIYFNRGSRMPKDKLKVIVTVPVMPNITKIGSGKLVCINTSTIEKLCLKQIGSGSISIGINAKELTAKVTGSGKIEVSGTIPKLIRKVSGSGVIRINGR